MEEARKMLLIPPETLSRLQQPSQPTIETSNITALDKEMMRILRLKDLDDSEKWSLYKRVLQKYLHFTSESKKPVTIPITSATTDAIVPTSSVNDSKLIKPTSTESVLADVNINNDDVLNQILNTIPQSLRKNTKSLYNHIQNSQQISWNRYGVISVAGTPVQGSNIMDLISDVVRNRKHSNPVGWEVFSKALAMSNIPETYIGNTRRQDFIRQQRAPYLRGIVSRKAVTTARRPKQGWARFTF